MNSGGSVGVGGIVGAISEKDLGHQYVLHHVVPESTWLSH